MSLQGLSSHVGSFSNINESGQSQAALSQSPSALAANMEAPHVHQTAHVVEKLEAATQVMPSALAANMEALHIHQTAHVVEKLEAATQVMPSDQFALKFDSVVPAILLPLSKVGLYLPDGKILVDTDAPIPLPYKPMLVIKDQTAAIVFEIGSSESDKAENDGGKTLGKKAEVLIGE